MANRASGAYRVGSGWAGETSSVGRSLNATVPAARWMYLYPAIDQHGQVIDVLVSRKRDLAATRRFFTVVLEHGARPIRGDPRPGAGLPLGIDELLPAALHVIGQYATDVIEADHGKLKSRLRPMRGLKRLRSAQVISAGHALVQNLRRGHYELATDLDSRHRLTTAFTELALVI